MSLSSLPSIGKQFIRRKSSENFKQFEPRLIEIFVLQQTSRPRPGKHARHRHGVLSCVPLSVIAQLTAEGGGSDREGADPVDVFTPRQFGKCGPISE